MFKKISQIKSPLYQGESNPTILENWLREFEKLFSAVSFPKEFKANNVVFYLRDEVGHWWPHNEDRARTFPGFWMEFI